MTTEPASGTVKQWPFRRRFLPRRRQWWRHEYHIRFLRVPIDSVGPSVRPRHLPLSAAAAAFFCVTSAEAEGIITACEKAATFSD